MMRTRTPGSSVRICPDRVERMQCLSFVNDLAHICTGYGTVNLNDHWAYDPVANVWTELGSLPAAARREAIAFVVDGRAYLGTGIGSTLINDLWEYEAISDTWIERSAPGASARSGASAFVLDGVAYVTSSTSMNDTLWRYDTNADQWEHLPMMLDNYRNGALSFVISDNAYIMLGRTSYQVRLFSAWKFSSVSQHWSSIRGMGGVPRKGSTPFTLNGYGHVCGGSPGTSFGIWEFLSDHWAYDPEADHWKPMAFSWWLTRSLSLAFAENGKAYVLTGGQPDLFEGQPAVSVEYDLQTNSWQVMQVPSQIYRYDAVGFWINGKGYVGMGVSSYWPELIFSDDLWEFDPEQDSWAPKAAFPGSARSGSRSFVLLGKAYVVGGDSTPGPGGIVNETWEYDPVADTWQQRASIPGPLVGTAITATHIGDKGYVCTNEALWEYDPMLDLWQPRTPPPVPFNNTSFAFSVGDKGYFGGGSESVFGTARKVFYEYAPADDDFNVSVPVHMAASLRIWPNPSKGYNINVNWTVPDDGPMEVDMLDVAGRQVRYAYARTGSGAAEVELLDPAPGVYLVRVRSIDSIAIGKVVVE